MTVNKITKLRIFLVPLSHRSWILHASTQRQIVPVTHTEFVLEAEEPSDSEPLVKEWIDDDVDQIHVYMNQIPYLNRLFRSKDSLLFRMLQRLSSNVHKFLLESKGKALSAPHSIRGRVYAMMEESFQRIDGYELFFGNIYYHQISTKYTGQTQPVEAEPRDDRFTFFYPSNMSSKLSLAHLFNISLQRQQYHHKWLRLNFCMMPLSALLGLLPGPNVFLFWNCFRCYSHYKAMKGADYVHDKINCNQFDFVANDMLSDVYQRLMIDDDSQVGSDKTVNVLTDASMEQLKYEFQCSHIVSHLQRIRFQIQLPNANPTQYALYSE